jgi:nucleoside-diphosphate-sugar epimerase
MSESGDATARDAAGPLLVTGASGFVGRHLIDAHRCSGDARQVLALVRDTTAWSRYDWTGALDDVSPVEGSVTDPDAWTPALPRLSGIFHLAAVVRHSRRDADELLRTNVDGSLAMVRLAAQHRCRLVVLSTSGTVGCFTDPDGHADEHAPWCEEIVAHWPYYRSKILLEKHARALADELGVELVFIRPPVLLGPGDHRSRSTGNVLRVLRGRLPFVIRGGMHFVDVRDAADAIHRAMRGRSVRPVYHLPGTAGSVEEFFRMVEEVSGAPAPRRVLPYRSAWLAASLLERLGVWLRGEPLHALPDPVVVEMASHYWGVRSLYAAEDLGYKSRDPRETLRDTVDWLRANHDALR